MYKLHYRLIFAPRSGHLLPPPTHPFKYTMYNRFLTLARGAIFNCILHYAKYMDETDTTYLMLLLERQTIALEEIAKSLERMRLDA